MAAVVAAPAMGSVWIAGDTARVKPPPDGGGDISTGARRRSVRLPRRTRRPGKPPAWGHRHGSLPLGPVDRHAAHDLVGLKFCLIASGEADVYVRCGPTMEWDTAAGDHILTCAGGSVVGPGGAPLTYGHEDRATGTAPSQPSATPPSRRGSTCPSRPRRLKAIPLSNRLAGTLVQPRNVSTPAPKRHDVQRLLGLMNLKFGPR